MGSALARIGDEVMSVSPNPIDVASFVRGPGG